MNKIDRREKKTKVTGSRSEQSTKMPFATSPPVSVKKKIDVFCLPTSSYISSDSLLCCSPRRSRYQMTLGPCRVGCDRLRVNGPLLGANESYCGRGGDGPMALNAQRQSLWFLFWMVKCSFTLYLLISYGMKA